MNTVIALYVTTQIALRDARDRFAEDHGQTTMEWMGIAAIIVGILAVMLGNREAIGAVVEERWRALFDSATAT